MPEDTSNTNIHIEHREVAVPLQYNWSIEASENIRLLSSVDAENALIEAIEREHSNRSSYRMKMRILRLKRSLQIQMNEFIHVKLPGMVNKIKDVIHITKLKYLTKKIKPKEKAEFF